MSTKKLYDESSYIKECDSTVLSCEKSDEYYDIVCESTCFFPEAGGQSGDRGTINGAKVFDTQIDDKGNIHHLCESEFKTGNKVHLSIDWERRHTFMQHHTGEHIFSGIVHRIFGYDNVGFHLSDNICTMDYNGTLTPEEVSDLMLRANESIFRNTPVNASYPSDEVLATLDYRCKGELNPPIRIVTIADGKVDTCACCAPHVSMTGEVGMLHVTEVKSYKGGVRLTIVCGRKLLALHSSYERILNDASHTLSVPYDELNKRVSNMMDERYELRQRIISLHNEALKKSISSIPDDAIDAIIFTGELETKTVRNSVNTLMKTHDGLCGIFYGDEKSGYKFILGSKNADMKITADTLRKELNAKCGGSSQMIQGSVNASEKSIRTLIP